MPAESQDDRVRLIAALADGQAHSSAELEVQLGWTPARISAVALALPEFGLRVTAGPDALQLGQPVELLDAGQLTSMLAPRTRARLADLLLPGITDSTSDRLRALPPPGPGRMLACMAEYQTGGRGRRGRRWLSPFAQGLCLSVRWRFGPAPESLASLNLAAAVALHGALSTAGVRGLGLKWPNDLVTAQGKVAGLLADLDSVTPQMADVTLGVGINLHVDRRMRDQVAATGGLAPAGIADLADRPLSRNALAALVLDAMGDALATFAEHGFAPFADDWRQRDVLYGRPVTVHAGERRLGGIAQGIASDGSLLIDVDGDLQSVVSGDVSVRAAP